MANVRTFLRSFGGGEVTPELLGRIDDAKYQSGLALCRNFITKPHGPAENRPGFEFVREVKNSASPVRVLPFTYSTTQTMVIEMGAGYFRFHTQGATLLNGGVPYEIPHPYAAQDLFDVHYVQSADVLTLVHPGYAPRELRRLGATNWELRVIDFEPPISAPATVSVAVSFPASANNPVNRNDTKTETAYVITAIAPDGVTESGASVAGAGVNNLFVTGAFNTVGWSASASASAYQAYKRQGGLYGYIGRTNGLSLVDDNIAPDLSRTPPRYDATFQVNGIVSVPVVNGGGGYGQSSPGGITAVTVINGGANYSAAPSLTVSDPTGSGATFSVSVANEFDAFNAPGTIIGVTVLTQGSGYTAPVLSLTDATGSGASLSPVFTPLEDLTVTLQVNDATGTGAVLAPVINDGAITTLTVVSPGKNYTNPTITITNAAGGSGAVFGPAVLSGTDYPGAVSYFEQRRCFAGTAYRPQNIWMTKSGTESNMSYSLPVRDDDRISFRVAAREANTIRHIVPLGQLLLLTGSAEWRVTSVNSDAITPSSISVQPQSYVGASNVQPVVINNTLIYGAARGGHVREMAYNWQASGFANGDLSLRAPHLFDGLDIVDMAYAKAPIPVVWCVSTSGKLLGLTYVPEQQVGAWHQHDTDGAFESCAVVAEGLEDALYCVVRRTINGVQKRYVERLHTRRFDTLADAFFVDCGATYRGTPATTISGLDHLEGQKVAILADGAVHPPRTVQAGVVKLEHAASVAHVGLPITADVQTLPVVLGVNDGAFGQGRLRNINKVWLRVHRSSGLFVGPREDLLTEAKQRSDEPYGTPPSIKTEEVCVAVSPSWGNDGQVFVRQSNPLPLTLVSMTLEAAVGG